MDIARIIYTTRNWNPVSSAIRHALPRSIFCAALSSHSIIDLGDGMGVEANMLHGVRFAPLDEMLHGLHVVAARDYAVPNKAGGVVWLLGQVGKRYDFKGAFGLVAPDRKWQEDDMWYCYELVAAYLKSCGLDPFLDHGHITERELLGINPKLALLP